MMELVGVIVAVALVFVLLFLRKNMALVMLGGSLVLALFMRVDLPESFGIIRDALTSADAINLLAAIMGIGILGELMYYNGAMEKAIAALKALIRDSRVLIMLLPSLIALLPIPGGAYFSAPLVEQVGMGLKMSPARKALANVYFRHFIMSVFPFFPGFIAMISLSDISAGPLAALSIPPVAVASLVGTWFIFRKTGRESPVKGEQLHFVENIKNFLYGLLPVILAAAALVVLGWPFWAALLPALAVALLQYLAGKGWPAELKNRLFLLLKGIPVMVLLGVAGIMVFKEFIANSGAMEQLSELFNNAGIPPVLLILLFPYLAGLVTGSCYASLGLTLPVLVPLLGITGNSTAMLVLAYQGAFWGYVVSPVHLCQLLTAEYFKVPLTAILPHLAWNGAVVLALSTAYLILL